jgi:hypothetical protein
MRPMDWTKDQDVPACSADGPAPDHSLIPVSGLDHPFELAGVRETSSVRPPSWT